MEFYLVIDGPPVECSLRAKSNHLVLTACSVRRLHTCTIHVVRQWYPKGPREVSVQAQSINYCVYTAIIWVTWARQRSSIGVAWDLPRYHGEPNLYCVFIIKPSHGASFVHAQSKRRRRAFLATLPRVQWRCRCGALPMLVYLPCAPLRSAFFRDAAGSPYERSPGVTRVLTKFRDREITWCCLYVNLHIIIF